MYLPRTTEVSSSKIKHDLYDAASVAESATDHNDLNTNGHQLRYKVSGAHGLSVNSLRNFWE